MTESPSPSNLLGLAQSAVDTVLLAEATSWTVSTCNDNNNAANERSIAIATHFLSNVFPLNKLSEPLLPNDQDRLVKIGRNISSIVEMTKIMKSAEAESTWVIEEAALKILCDQGSLILFPRDTGYTPVPKIRFGRTDLQISMATLGCMRLQQTWAQDLLDISQVQPTCQDTLVQLLKHALCDLHMNHIETARGYGSSEMQLGAALQQLFQQGHVRRKDLILQTKIGIMKPADFRKALDTSLHNLQVDYVDLLAIHGFNLDSQWDTVFGKMDDDDDGDSDSRTPPEDDTREESLMGIVEEYRNLGKIRFVGFSTHGRVPLISRIIETDKFDYVNLHYHPFSSYTASGEGLFGAGNLENIILANKHDMGVFIISPYDKGGKLYAPSIQVRRLTLPEMEPIVYGTLFHWTHPLLFTQQYPHKTLILPEIHTISCGAARPSDLDEIAYAAHLWTHAHEKTVKNLVTVQRRIQDEQECKLGRDWMQTWFVGLPNCSTEDDAYQLAQIVSLYNLIQSLGLLDYARDRYSTFDGNLSKWDFNLSTRNNIQTSLNKIVWG